MKTENFEIISKNLIPRPSHKNDSGDLIICHQIATEFNQHPHQFHTTPLCAKKR